MAAANKDKHTVTLPEGVSLERLAQVLLDAWEADPRRWILIDTRLQSGVKSCSGNKPFQRLVGIGKAVKTALKVVVGHHRAEARC